MGESPRRLETPGGGSELDGPQKTVSARHHVALDTLAPGLEIMLEEVKDSLEEDLKRDRETETYDRDVLVGHMKAQTRRMRKIVDRVMRIPGGRR